MTDERDLAAILEVLEELLGELRETLELPEKDRCEE